MLIEVSKLSNLSASIVSRVYPNNSLSGQLVQSGGTRDRGVNIVSVPTKSGRLATMQYPCSGADPGFWDGGFFIVLHNLNLTTPI